MFGNLKRKETLYPNLRTSQAASWNEKILGMLRVEYQILRHPKKLIVRCANGLFQQRLSWNDFWR